MREFFRGWKRKAGCVTLLLACVFAAGWVRGAILSDALVELPLRLGLAVNTHSLSIVSFDGIPFPSTSYVAPGEPDPDAAINFDQKVVSASFGFATVVPFMNIPFWQIVAPLTLFSAWLLLSKSRAGKTTVLTEQT